jgi:TatD DNase family protein
MGLIDTHTHLESFARQGTLSGALTRAKAAGVDAMITIGTAPDDWSEYRDLATRESGYVQYTVGLHPCSVGADWLAAVTQITGFWTLAQTGAALGPVALGECGLDRFHLPKDDPAAAEQMLGWQKAAFTAQLAIAKQLRCPVVVHSRGAFQECVDLIDASGVEWRRVIFHCFTEGEPEMRALMERGGYGSFTGILTYKTADAIRSAAKLQGLARFMLETDAPYLTPMPHRGKPNEPGFVRHTAEFAAEQVFGVPYERLATVSSETARQVFGLR